MIDIVKQIQAKNPALGTAIIVLRADSRALADPETLAPEARAWLDREAPGARFSRESILLAPYPGAEPIARTVSVLAFADSRQLAAFATTWTGDGLPED